MWRKVQQQQQQLLMAAFVVFASSSDALRILLVPVMMPSHMACLGSIGEALAERGHQVHMIVAKDYPLPSARLESVVTVERYDRPALGQQHDINELYDNITRLIMEDRARPEEVIQYISERTVVECRRLVMHNDPLMSRLNEFRFDLAIVDGLFMLKYLYLVPHRLQIPWVTMTDSFEPWVARAPWLPSFVPNAISSFSDKMTFLERLQNSFMTALLASVPIVPDPPEDILDRYRAYGHFDTMNDLAAKSLLWILTSDTILNYARPLMPNMIEAGGLTARPATGKLPDDIQSLVDSAETGIILVSFGSAASQFPKAIVDKFIAAFSQLDGYKIIWRFKNKNKILLPKNLMALHWMPQNDLLAHPKTRLFITHCGNNGQYESLYHAVPMIGFPFNGDQPYNARRMESKGFGLAMDIHEFTADELVSNIRRILSDVTFKTRISKASDIFKSAPQTSREKAAWWVEHVTKFGGSHLRSAGNDLAIYQYLMLDVLGFVLVVAVLLIGCVLKTLCFLRGRILSRTKAGDKKKRQ